MNLLQLLTGQYQTLIIGVIKFIGQIIAYSIIILIILYVFNNINISCTIPPKKGNYETPECWQFVDCLYRTDKDKSICGIFADSCKNSYIEMRYIKKLEYCKNNRPNDMSENECRIWINQK
jgi:hypothetical protein